MELQEINKGEVRWISSILPKRFLGKHSRDHVRKEDKMFKNRSFNLVMGLTIAVLAVLSISAFFVSDNNAVSAPAVSMGADRYAALKDKQLAGLDIVASVASTSADRYSALKDKQLAGLDIVAAAAPSTIIDRYSVLKDKQLERLALVAFVVSTSADRYSALKDKQLEVLDTVAPAVSTITDRYSALKDKQLQRFDSAGVATPK